MNKKRLIEITEQVLLCLCVLAIVILFIMTILGHRVDALLMLSLALGVTLMLITQSKKRRKAYMCLIFVLLFNVFILVASSVG